MGYGQMQFPNPTKCDDLIYDMEAPTRERPKTQDILVVNSEKIRQRLLTQSHEFVKDS